jgi:hypothetical protein
MERYRNHLNGERAGRKWISRFGVGLLPKAYAAFNPMLGRDKEDVELALAEAFRGAGFVVYGPRRQPGR